MATYEYELQPQPTDDERTGLWLQHGAGFIVFQDARQYAIDSIPSGTAPKTKRAIIEGIDNAIYGLMMIWDGVSGELRNSEYAIRLETKARLIRRNEDEVEEEIISELDLFEGDGSCMGYHGWKEGDFGSLPLALPKEDYS